MHHKNILYLLALSLFAISCCEPKNPQKPANEFTFAFLTDIHVQPELNAIEGFRTAIAKVNELNPDFVITGGDLVMDALGTPYSRVDTLYNIYTGMLKEFKMPVYNTIGNHEHFGWYKRSGADPSHPEYGDKMFEKRIGPRYQRVDKHGWIFFLLDSVVKDTLGGGYYGEIDAEQMAWLKEQLASIPDTVPIVISTHIPLMTLASQVYESPTVANDSGLIIVNAKQVEELLKDHNLKLVLQGHLHYFEDLYVFGTSYVTAGAVSASWWEGPYMDTEEGFLLVKVKADDLSWEYIDYGWNVSP